MRESINTRGRRVGDMRSRNPGPADAEEKYLTADGLDDDLIVSSLQRAAYSRVYVHCIPDTEKPEGRDCTIRKQQPGACWSCKKDCKSFTPSIVLINEAAREVGSIRIYPAEPPVKDEDSKRWYASMIARDLITGDERVGDGMGYLNSPFGRTQARRKAERNALRAIISQTYLQALTRLHTALELNRREITKIPDTRVEELNVEVEQVLTRERSLRFSLGRHARYFLQNIALMLPNQATAQLPSGQEVLPMPDTGFEFPGMVTGPQPASSELGPGDLCPECGEQTGCLLAEKRNKEGGKFVGCSGFPQCDFIVGRKKRKSSKKKSTKKESPEPPPEETQQEPAAPQQPEQQELAPGDITVKDIEQLADKAGISRETLNAGTKAIFNVSMPSLLAEFDLVNLAEWLQGNPEEFKKRAGG